MSQLICIGLPIVYTEQSLVTISILYCVSTPEDWFLTYLTMQRLKSIWFVDVVVQRLPIKNDHHIPNKGPFAMIHIFKDALGAIL